MTKDTPKTWGFMFDDGFKMVDEMTREELLQVIDYLKSEKDRERDLAQHRAKLLGESWKRSTPIAGGWI